MSMADKLMLAIHEAYSPEIDRQLAYDKTKELWRYAKGLEDKLTPKPTSALERIAITDDFAES